MQELLHEFVHDLHVAVFTQLHIMARLATPNTSEFVPLLGAGWW